MSKLSTLLTLTPWTKRILIICASVVLIVLIVAAAMTGDLDLLIQFIKSCNGK
jgi:uncharacterized membrane protein (DUF373 family)